MRLANVDSVDIVVRGVGGHGAYPQTTKDPIVLASPHRDDAADPRQPREQPARAGGGDGRQLPGGHKHNIIPDEAKLQLTVRSYTPEVRKLLLDGIARIARGEAIAAGMPDDRMPVVTVRDNQYTPSTFNTEKLADRAFDLFGAHFGADRVVLPPLMGGEDFSQLLARRQDQGSDHLLGRRRAQGEMGRGRRRHDTSCPRSTARSGRPMPKR